MSKITLQPILSLVVPEAGTRMLALPNATNPLFLHFRLFFLRKLGDCAMTTSFLDYKICTFKLSLSWRFPREAIFFGPIFLLSPQCPSHPPRRHIFYLCCRLAVSEKKPLTCGRCEMYHGQRNRLQMDSKKAPVCNCNGSLNPPIGCTPKGGHATTRFLEGFLEGSLTGSAS